MPTLPIDNGLLVNPEMARIFEEDTRIQRMLDVEAALAWAHAEVGNIPQKDAGKIAAMASLEHVKLNRVKEVELDTKHDIVALVRVLAETCGASGAYVHLGATSSDITDTATALQLKDALDLIVAKLLDLRETLEVKASEIPINTCFYSPEVSASGLTSWFHEISRHTQRLLECKKRVLVGKMSGAVGTQSAFGPHAARIQKLVMKRLGIEAAEISTQILQRDRHGELVCLLAGVAATLEKIAIAFELEELKMKNVNGVGLSWQDMSPQGTSGDRDLISSLGKMVRSLVVPALENMLTKHEQDLTQSSSERFIIPQACILVDYMLFIANDVTKKSK